MGYTHYWSVQRSFTKAEWAAITADAYKLTTNSPVALTYEYDSNLPPLVDDAAIRFNGVGDAGHETFLLHREPEDFQFCKTAQKPYDMLVTALLIVAAKHGGDAISVSSDGDVDEWEPGLRLVRERCGPDYANPIR